MKSNWKKHFGVGKNVVIKDGLLKGAKGQIVRGSQRTGNRIVKLTEDFSTAYKTGTEVSVAPYEYHVVEQ